MERIPHGVHTPEFRSEAVKLVEQEGLSEVPDNFLITNPKNSKILEKLKLELIPRYIIFDKQGNIVEMNAPRPSDKQVTTTIDKYLK